MSPRSLGGQRVAASEPRASRRFFRPTWAEIDLAKLRGNLKGFRARMPSGVRLMFVVKGNAYGHGALDCARAAQQGRLADWLGVSSVEEGVQLREGGIRLPILVLGSLYPFESFLAAVEHGLTPTVASLESAQRLAQVARRLERPVDCHVKIETGMGRIGVGPQAAARIADFLAGQPSLRLTGLYTHLSCVDTDKRFTKDQLLRFQRAVAVFRGWKNLVLHAANSAAALNFPESRLDLVRPGLAIYGLYRGFDPVMSLKSQVIFLKTVEAGAPISYDASFRVKRRSRIATIPLGYADGLSRRFSTRGSVLLRGRRCPIVGRITMDMTMIDVSASAECRVGDEAVILGDQGKESITAGELAVLAETIPYEITTMISHRVPRVYLP
ncbi:MAG: alanine racemase [Elusimicrobia bacterium]|nr:alanine racemase [Elusimicrobiota bacterium]